MVIYPTKGIEYINVEANGMRNIFGLLPVLLVMILFLGISCGLTACMDQYTAGEKEIMRIEWPEYNEEKLLADSELIVRIKVNRRYRELKDMDLSTPEKEPVTEFLVDVLDIIKGQGDVQPAGLCVVQPGNSEVDIVSLPLLKIGREYVLMLKQVDMKGEIAWAIEAPYQIYNITDSGFVQGLTGSSASSVWEKYEDFKQRIQKQLGIEPEEEAGHEAKNAAEVSEAE